MGTGVSECLVNAWHAGVCPWSTQDAMFLEQWAKQMSFGGTGAR